MRYAARAPQRGVRETGGGPPSAPPAALLAAGGVRRGRCRPWRVERVPGVGSHRGARRATALRAAEPVIDGRSSGAHPRAAPAEARAGARLRARILLASAEPGTTNAAIAGRLGTTITVTKRGTRSPPAGSPGSATNRAPARAQDRLAEMVCRYVPDARRSTLNKFQRFQRAAMDGMRAIDSTPQADYGN
jgi:hypothetical protein